MYLTGLTSNNIFVTDNSETADEVDTEGSDEIIYESDPELFGDEDDEGATTSEYTDTQEKSAPSSLQPEDADDNFLSELISVPWDSGPAETKQSDNMNDQWVDDAMSSLQRDVKIIFCL